MPRYDFKCPNGHVREEYMLTAQDMPVFVCLLCREPMVKQPCAPNFSIKGYSAKNGYTKEHQ